MGGADTSNDDTVDNNTPDCITSEEAINGNLKKKSISTKDQTKCDQMTFLKSKEYMLRSLLN